ncbi:MAG: rhodanese-like domain-containing protein [Gemmatimonadota bacterium]
MMEKSIMPHHKSRRVFSITLVSIFAAVGSACGQDQAPAASIEASELASRIDDGTAPFLLDVRTPAEYAEGHVTGAVNIPHTELADRLGELDFGLSEELVVYCRSGRRAAVAESILAEAGFTGVRDLEGHISGWQAAELPLVTGVEESPAEESPAPESAEPAGTSAG